MKIIWGVQKQNVGKLREVRGYNDASNFFSPALPTFHSLVLLIVTVEWNFFLLQLLRSSLVNNRTQAKVAEELGMQEFAITNDKTKRPVALRTKTLADLLECELIWL